MRSDVQRGGDLHPADTLEGDALDPADLRPAIQGEAGVSVSQFCDRSMTLIGTGVVAATRKPSCSARALWQSAESGRGVRRSARPAPARTPRCRLGT